MSQLSLEPSTRRLKPQAPRRPSARTAVVRREKEPQYGRKEVAIWLARESLTSLAIDCGWPLWCGRLASSTSMARARPLAASSEANVSTSRYVSTNILRFAVLVILIVALASTLRSPTVPRFCPSTGNTRETLDQPGQQFAALAWSSRHALYPLGG